jgi:RNA polymerase sigma-54 factor
MILKDVADRIGYNISTISRVSNSKYVQCEHGVYPLKALFSESMTTESGEEVSAIEIKSLLKTFIENEEKKKPLTDEALAEKMKQRGYVIARRTIVKYREQLGIPIARLRKEL